MKEKTLGAGTVVQIKLPPVTPASFIRVFVQLEMAPPLSIQIPANVFGKAVDNGPSAWSPAIHVGDTGRVPSPGSYSCLVSKSDLPSVKFSLLS